MKAVVSLLYCVAVAQASPTLFSLFERADSALTDCLKAARLNFVDPSSSDWKTAIQPWNTRVPVTPEVVVYATAVQHIQDAVKCAAKNKIKVAAKSGGHSYASFGLGGSDGHLVIQLDRMYGVTVRYDKKAIIKGGTRLGYVAMKLYEQGKRAIAHGTCPSVGIGGHVVHGGFGFSSHTHGLAVDGMTGAQVVLADGSLVRASKTENPDLFWAIRGAGSSFGIVVEFEFDTFPAPNVVTYGSVTSKVTASDRATAVAGMLEFQKILKSGGMAKELNMRLGLSPGGTQALEVVYHGNMEGAKAALQPFVKPLGLDFGDKRTTLQQGQWFDQLNTWAYGETLNITYPYKGQDNAYQSSLTIKEIPEGAMTAFVEFLQGKASLTTAPRWWIQMDVHGDSNSSVIANSNGDTSYAHRDKMWLIQFASPTFFTNNPSENIRFINEFIDRLKNNLNAGSWGRYANYVDAELSRGDAVQQYWSGNTDRLRSIKGSIDPLDLFNNPHSIQAAN